MKYFLLCPIISYSFLCFGSDLAPNSNFSKNEPINPGTQIRVVELFSENKCEEINSLIKPTFYDQLRPNVLAIVAFCDPKGQDTEKMFAMARAKEPTGDLIMVLQATHTWKQNPEKSMPLWQDVLKFARNPYLQSMAKEYLAGNVTEAQAISLSRIAFYGNAQVGAAYDSKPINAYRSVPSTSNSQTSEHLRINMGAQKWLPFGSVAGNYFGNFRYFPKNKNLSDFLHDLEFPLNLRVGTYEDIVFRPFIGANLQEGTLFHSYYGMGIMGIAYRSEYKQSVQASIFSDHFHPADLRPQEGVHFRFEYNWEFFPQSWVFRFLTFIERTKAAQDFNNGTDITYTHTDIGANLGTRYTRDGIVLGLDLKPSFRTDSLPSYYTNQKGQYTVKQRKDYKIAIQPNLVIPVFSYVQFAMWYEYDRAISNLNADDYANYNLINHTVGMALKTQFSNY